LSKKAFVEEMNIILINYEYPPLGGGASNATFHIANELFKEGHQVTVLTSKFENLNGHTIEDGIHIFRVNSVRKQKHQSSIFEMMSFIFVGYRALGNIIRNREIESAILFFSIPCGVFGPYLKRKFKVNYIVSLRGGDVPGLEKRLKYFHILLAPLRKFIFRSAKAIIANSNGLAKKSEEADPFPVSIIPNGVDTTFYFPDPAMKHADDVFRFLFVGRFDTQKNILAILNQIMDLKANSQKAFTFDIVGEGPLKASLLTFVEERKLEQIVTFHNWLTKIELRKIYQQSDCLINYSLSEGMPNVVLEAMAAGLPIIASDIMGHDDLIINGKSGFLVGIDNPTELYRIMKYAIENNGIMNQMGLFAKEFILENFSWRKTAQDYVNYFK